VDSAWVRAGASRGGDVIAELPAGAAVSVLEVVMVSEEFRVRGRISSPIPGWISLADTRSCYRWAARLQTAETTPSVGHASQATGELPPPGSMVSPEALELLRLSFEARQRGEAEARAPDKSEDQWTSSLALREDLAREFIAVAKGATVLEVGSYFGYTTRLLSQMFHRVIALDAMPQFLQANREYNIDRDNIFYLKFHTLEGDWGVFASNEINVIFLDASHDYETVKSDIINCLRLQTVSMIIFDDYGAELGVRVAVNEAISEGILRPIGFLGEGASGSWKLKDGRTIEQREAIACEPIRAQVPADTESVPTPPPPASPPPPKPVPPPPPKVPPPPSPPQVPSCALELRGAGHAEPGGGNRRCGTCCGASDTSSPMCAGSTWDGRLAIAEEEAHARCLADSACAGYSRWTGPGGETYVRPVAFIDSVASSPEWQTHAKVCGSEVGPHGGNWPTLQSSA